MKTITKYYSELLDKTFDDKDECCEAEAKENTRLETISNKKNACSLLEDHINAYVKTYGELPKLEKYCIREIAKVTFGDSIKYLQGRNDYSNKDTTDDDIAHAIKRVFNFLDL